MEERLKKNFYQVPSYFLKLAFKNQPANSLDFFSVWVYPQDEPGGPLQGVRAQQVNHSKWSSHSLGTRTHMRGTEGVPAADSPQLPQDTCDTGPEGPGDCFSLLHAGQALKKIGHLEKSSEHKSDVLDKNQNKFSEDLMDFWRDASLLNENLSHINTHVHPRIRWPSADLQVQRKLDGPPGSCYLFRGWPAFQWLLWQAHKGVGCLYHLQVLEGHDRIVLVLYIQGLKLYHGPADYPIIMCDRHPEPGDSEHDLGPNNLSAQWSPRTAYSSAALWKPPSLEHGGHRAKAEEGAHWSQLLGVVPGGCPKLLVQWLLPDNQAMGHPDPLLHPCPADVSGSVYFVTIRNHFVWGT